MVSSTKAKTEGIIPSPAALRDGVYRKWEGHVASFGWSDAPGFFTHFNDFLGMWKNEAISSACCGKQDQDTGFPLLMEDHIW